MEESATPASTYIEKLLNAIEEEEYEAEDLKEVIARSEEEDLDLVPRLGPDGTFNLRSLKKVGKLPDNTEQFRSKITLIPNSFSRASKFQKANFKACGRLAQAAMGIRSHASSLG